MTVKLDGGRFQAAVDPLGAELKSLFDTRQQRQYIWGGDPAWWGASAPVLFPIIGGLNGGFYRYQDREYRLASHGFVRTSACELLSSSPGSAVFRLVSTDRTKEVYPFDFELYITFTMDYAGISVSYRVVHAASSGRMFFSIGSHPAFRLPFDGGVLEDYYLHFSRSEDAPRNFFSGGCLTGETGEGLTNSRQLFISRSTFDDGPIIFTDIASRELQICKSRGKTRISVSFDAPNLAVWSKPKGAPFLCIEPWHGIPDPSDFEDSLEHKPGIIALEAGETFTTGYRVMITDGADDV